MSTNNHTFTRGDTYKFDVEVLSQGAAFNCNGGTLVMTAKVNPSDATPVFTRSSAGSGISWTNQASGQARVTIAGANTSGLANVSTALRYDLQLTTATGEVYTVAQGVLYIRPEIST